MNAIAEAAVERRDVEIVGDLSDLPDYNFGPTSLGWWGVFGFMLIEGMGFVLAIGAYFYLFPFEHHWPPVPVRPPSLLWGTAFTVVALLSLIPNLWLDRKAHRQELRPVQWGLTLMSVLGLVLVVLRACEFTALNVRWDQNAYGSITWALIALHTTHITTDVYDSLVLNVLVFRKKVDGRKFSDVSDNALYWYFIVASWVVLYVIIYWTPRWL
ncbi:MAG TPA: cytochrome c oxidase subunit 3 [Rudaea sp.]|jgi:heme/copper-type cytochrome/quinol oxidase subunit 3